MCPYKSLKGYQNAHCHSNNISNHAAMSLSNAFGAIWGGGGGGGGLKKNEKKKEEH